MEKKKKVNATHVRVIQAELQLSTAQMAAKLGVSAPHYREKLHGSRNFTLNDVITLQAISGKSFDWIIDDQ